MLSILNWSGTASTLGTSASDRLIFTGSASAFTSGYAQSDEGFAGFGTGYSAIHFGGEFEIVAVPEPATILARWRSLDWWVSANGGGWRGWANCEYGSHGGGLGFREADP